MSDIVAFLNARLDEDEALANAAQGKLGAESRWWTWRNLSTGASGIARSDAQHIEHQSPARVLREVKAKRELIEDWRRRFERYMRDENDGAAGAAWAAMDNVLVTLAGAYRTHPDYAGDQVGDWAWPDPDDKVRRADAT